MSNYKYKYSGKYKEIIQDWGDKSDCESYEFKIDAWLEQFDSEEKQISMELLKNFQMYRRIFLENKIQLLISNLNSIIPDANDIIVFFMLLHLDNRLANSTQFAFEIRKILGKEVYDCNDLQEDQISLLKETMVFIDDYSGSGDSFIETVSYLIEKHPELAKFKFVFLVLNISEMAYFNICQFAKNYNLSIKIVYADQSVKAFKLNHIFPESIIKEKKQKYFKLCLRYCIDSAFGYKHTESLVAFNECIPNNNLAIFRDKSKDGSGASFIPLFQRIRPNKNEFINNQNKKKLKALESNKYIKNNSLYLFKVKKFACYLDLKGKSANMSDICKAFGMNSQQFQDMLDYCLVNDLIENDNGAYIIKRYFWETFDKNEKKIKSIFKKIINNKIDSDLNMFYDTIKYTPIDFEKRFSGYNKEGE